MDLQKLLSPPQYEAATRLDAPVCILAGAGSGKTRVITHRIAWLMTAHREAGEHILAVTFTNKAAGEMRERVEKLVPGRGRHVLLGTFHGLAARLLRKYGRLVDLHPSFVIYDADDSERMLARLVTGDLNLDKEKAKGIGHLIDSWQCEGLLPADVPPSSLLLHDAALKAYDLYLQRLQEQQAIDFGGLLVKLRQLVTGPDAGVLTKKVRHVLVDEYQDVNQVQADIVLALAASASSTAVVGDDDQAIYGWRGASADNLKKFLVALPNAVLVKLEENYRSTPAILEAANGIIRENTQRLGKELRPGRDDVMRGRNVRVVKGSNDVEEARRVTSLLVEHVASGMSLDEIAILYRASSASRLFEEELSRHGLPYRVVGGVRFYDRKEVKDVIATLRVCFNRKSDVDALRFLAAVPRGIGQGTLAKVDAVGRHQQQSLLEAFASPSTLAASGLNAGAIKKCEAVIQSLDELAHKIGRPRVITEAASLIALPSNDGVLKEEKQQSLFAAAAAPPSPTPSTTTIPLPTGAHVGAKDAVALAIQASGIADRLEAEQTEEAKSRLENLQELVNAAALFENEAARAQQPSDVEAFLEQSALQGSVDEKDEEDDRGQITLMTLHAAKGLEFDVVFLCGLEENGFPHARVLFEDDGGKGLEEERRLAYVGITRAKNRLVMSWAARRMVNGQTKPREPSRFLFEVPREVLEGDVPRKGGRDSLLDLWRERRTPAPPAGTNHVVYDDDDVIERPRKPSRTTLVMIDPADVPVDAIVHEPFEAPIDVPVEVPRPTRKFMLGAQKQTEQKAKAEEEQAPAPSALDDADAPFRAGDRVFHRHFGDGSVVGLRGSGRSTNVLVRFDSERSPRLIAARHLKSAG